MTPDEALSKAKINLMARPDSVFFTTICFGLKQEWNTKCKTAATNGLVLKINPDFFMSLNTEERVFLLIHESMHVALLHTLRVGERDHERYNVAADHVINLMLIERGFKMPSIGCADRAFSGMSTEQVYALLPENATPSMGMDIESATGSPDDSNGQSSGARAEIEQQIQDIIVRAAIQSKMQGDKPGTIPGDIQIFLDNLLNPKLPWHSILRRYMQASAKNDYTFKKPNRRFFPDHILPSLSGQGLIDFTVAVDTSGSVSDEEFKVFISELNSILKKMKPETITVIHFDTRIKSVDKVSSVRDLMDVKFTGRGGTRIEPLMEWANANKPKLLLVFTDGEFYFNGTSTKANTVWLIHNNKDFKSTFGKKIHYEI